MTDIAFYIGSHGYGHAARQQAVINALAALGGRAHVRTAAPQKFFKAAASYYAQRYDIGMIQHDSLTLDVAASLRWYADFLQKQAALVAAEAEWCQEQGIQLVVSDMPPFAMEVAARAGLPSVAVTHFTWDWVYAHYVDAYPQYAWIVEACRESYQKADLALQMPFGHEFDMFQQVEPIPLVINAATQDRQMVRALMDIPADHKMGLLSMGGHAWGKVDISRLKALEGWVFLVQAGAWEQVRDVPQRFRKIPMDYEDYHNLLAAADLVIGKAGGSTTAEVIGHRTPIIYTTPPNWREARLLRAALDEYAVSRYVPAEAFQSGAWLDEIAPLMAQAQDWKPIAAHGADVAARRLLALAAQRA